MSYIKGLGYAFYLRRGNTSLQPLSEREVIEQENMKATKDMLPPDMMAGQTTTLEWIDPARGSNPETETQQ